MQGPDRFWFEARAASARSLESVDVVPVPDGATLRLQVRNNTTDKLRLNVKSLAYDGDSRTVPLPKGKSRDVRWPTDAGWFDVEVTSGHDPKFRLRVTGRTDHPGKSVTV